MDDLRVIINRWINCRQTWQAKSGAPNPGDIQLFMDELTHLSEQLIGLLGTRNPEMVEALGECAMHAAAHLNHPKLMGQ